jgi:hypothetical protein
MDEDKIVNLNQIRLDRETDNSKWNIQDMLEDAMKEITKDEYTKAVLILLNDKDGAYTHRRLVVDMSNTQMIALLQVVSSRLLKEMGEAE